MSYLPEIAYRYGKDARGYALLLALTDPALKRREYPEVSFSVASDWPFFQIANRCAVLRWDRETRMAQESFSQGLGQSGSMHRGLRVTRGL
jgi:hypothetical protein